MTGSDFFKLSPLLAFGMPPLIFKHMLLDHQSVCKEHGYTIPVYHYDFSIVSMIFLPLNYALRPHKLFLCQQVAKLKKKSPESTFVSCGR
jgi:hypothetical protein